MPRMLFPIVGPGLANTVAPVSVFSVPTFARVLRATALAVRETEFVTACRALEASDFRVIVPSPVAPLRLAGGRAGEPHDGFGDSHCVGLVVFGSRRSAAVFPEWGAMLSKGRELIRVTPIGAVAPDVAITLVVASLGLLGDALKEALEP